MVIYLCPLTQKECIEEFCAWWISKAEKCAIVCMIKNKE